jgi:hypothetical protein
LFADVLIHQEGEREVSLHNLIHIVLIKHGIYIIPLSHGSSIIIVYHYCQLQCSSCKLYKQQYGINEQQRRRYLTNNSGGDNLTNDINNNRGDNLTTFIVGGTETNKGDISHILYRLVIRDVGVVMVSV